MVQHNYKKGHDSVSHTNFTIVSCAVANIIKKLSRTISNWFSIYVHFWKKKNVHWNFWQGLAPIDKKLAHFTIASSRTLHRSYPFGLLMSSTWVQSPKCNLQMIFNSCLIFGRKKYSLKCWARSGSDSQKACPIYSSELCGNTHNTEAILLVCCHHQTQFLSIDFN